MKHTTSQTLYAYWNDVRDGRPAPRRFDIEPSCISAILAETIILERVDFETYRFRLVGTRICDLFGAELRGRDLFEFWDCEGDRMTLEHHLSMVCRQFRAAVFLVEADTDTKQTIELELIFLPLVHTRGLVDRCLGALSIGPGIDAGAVRGLDRLRIVSAELITPPRHITSSAPVSRERDVFDAYTGEVRSARIVRSDRRQFRVYDGGLANTDPDKPAR